MEALLVLAAFATAVVSATVGMAGGLMLLGVYLVFLDVPTATFLHGVTQLFANGLRAGLRPAAIHWQGLPWYILGAAAAWLGLRGVAVVPDVAWVYLGLGLLPFVARLAPRHPALDFVHRRGATLVGFLVTGMQVFFGVAGPVLDVFFAETTLDRKGVVATKAATQTLSHLGKVAWFLPLLTEPPAPGRLLAILAAAAAGTFVGGRLLDRWSEEAFRRRSGQLLLLIGVGCLLCSLRHFLAAAQG